MIMTRFVVVNGKDYPVKEITGRMSDSEWEGRETKTITMETTYTDIKKLFKDNTSWAIKCHYEPDEKEKEEGKEPFDEVFDNSDFLMSGKIVDTRDGFMSITMGKLSEMESLISDIYGSVN